jgi:hypothetical protein
MAIHISPSGARAGQWLFMNHQAVRPQDHGYSYITKRCARRTVAIHESPGCVSAGPWRFMNRRIASCLSWNSSSILPCPPRDHFNPDVIQDRPRHHNDALSGNPSFIQQLRITTPASVAVRTTRQETKRTALTFDRIISILQNGFENHVCSHRPNMEPLIFRNAWHCPLKERFHMPSRLRHPPLLAP